MAGTARRVLVVEDDSAIRMLIRRTLEGEGLMVDAAADGFEALRLARAHRPDVVALDLALPRISGEEVAHRLRALLGPDLPILLVSASTKLAEHATRIGAFSQLAKPFDLERLITAVLRGIEMQRGAGGPQPIHEDLQPLPRRGARLRARPHGPKNHH